MVVVFLVVAHEVDVVTVSGSASGSGASSCCSSENFCLNA